MTSATWKDEAVYPLIVNGSQLEVTSKRSARNRPPALVFEVFEVALAHTEVLGIRAAGRFEISQSQRSPSPARWKQTPTDLASAGSSHK